MAPPGSVRVLVSEQGYEGHSRGLLEPAFGRPGRRDRGGRGCGSVRGVTAWLVPDAAEPASDVELDVVVDVEPPEQPVPAAELFDPRRPTLDLVAMRREHERIVASEIAAGRMADWPDSFRGFPLGVEGRDWFW